MSTLSEMGKSQEASAVLPAAVLTPVPREVLIQPPKGFARLDFADLVRHRGILWRRSSHRVRVQYDDMFLGLFWAVARPLIMLAVLWGFRGLAASNLGVSIPYPLYVYSGLVVWFYFTESTQAIAKSLQKDAGLIQKIYFPRLISPLSSLLAETYNLGLAFVPLSILMLVLGVPPCWYVLLLPLVLLQIMILSLGLGLLFSSLILWGKDWERILKFLLYVGFWLSPVFYSPTMIPSKLALLYFSNPMGGSLLAMRAVLFSGFEFPWWAWLYSSVLSIVLLFAGLLLFQRTEASIADRL